MQKFVSAFSIGALFVVSGCVAPPANPPAAQSATITLPPFTGALAAAPAPSPSPSPPPPSAPPMRTGTVSIGGVPQTPSMASAMAPASTPGCPPSGFGSPPLSSSSATPICRYDEVIPFEGTKTQKGVVLYHKSKDRHYFEIPPELIGRDFLFSTEIAQSSAGLGFNGLPLGYRVVRFERYENHLILRNVSFRNRADDDLKAAAQATDLSPIIMAFRIEAEGDGTGPKPPPPRPTAARPPSVTTALAPATSAPPAAQTETSAGDRKEDAKTPDERKDASKEAKKGEEKKSDKPKWLVINVTPLLTTMSPDLVDARNAGRNGLGFPDPSRSVNDSVKVFKENVEIRSTMTFMAFPMPAPGAPMTQAPNVSPSKTAVLHYSLSLLPAQPMQGRLYDPRVGYFTDRFEEYSARESRTKQQQYVTRFRLEKKDPTANLSEPVEPIVFYIAPEVPKQWRSYLKAGIEAWQPAFERAGFKNAIIAKDAPTKEEDPNWDPEDARYSVIRWVAMPIANAMGPSVTDPRSGEVISAHIIFWHDIVWLMERLYFIQAGSADPRVNVFPLPENLIGEMLQSVATHEVGHTLGLRHNHRASTAYSVKSLRDPVFTSENGTSASIMSYGRFNSVAQPGDGVKNFIPRLGPYDYFAIEWGYKPLGKDDPKAERDALDQMAAKQLDNPMLAFAGEDWASFFDPEVVTENIGKERIEATRLSLKSVERAALRAITATTKLGEDYSELRRLYNFLVYNRSNYLDSAVRMIGGVREKRALAGRGDASYVRVPKDEQLKAIRFLLDEAFTTPTWLTDPKVLDRISVFDVTYAFNASQAGLLAGMLSPVRFRLMEDAESMRPGSGLSASAYMRMVQQGLFKELASPQPKIDIYRRELQRAYIEQLKGFSGEIQKLNSTASYYSFLASDLSIDLRPAAINALKQLKQEVASGALRAKDEPTRLFLQQLQREVTQILKVSDAN
jgi:hypothetical protein